MMQSKAERIRNLKIFAGIMGSCSLPGRWTTTQRIAADCVYPDILGKHISWGEIRIYLL